MASSLGSSDSIRRAGNRAVGSRHVLGAARYFGELADFEGLVVDGFGCSWAARQVGHEEISHAGLTRPH